MWRGPCRNQFHTLAAQRTHPINPTQWEGNGFGLYKVGPSHKGYVGWVPPTGGVWVGSLPQGYVGYLGWVPPTGWYTWVGSLPQGVCGLGPSHRVMLVIWVGSLPQGGIREVMWVGPSHSVVV